jgi:hypothetical protein
MTSTATSTHGGVTRGDYEGGRGHGLVPGVTRSPYITVAVFRRVAVLLLSVMDCLLGAVTSRYLLPGRSWLSGSGYG